MKADRASATAEVIAASTVLLAGDPGTASLVAPGAVALCEAFLGDGPRGRFLCWSARRGWMRPVWRAIERATHPGIVRHYWLRKRWIEARVRAALVGEVRRVVVLGAGLDTLALRLAPTRRDVDWVEVDHPATQAAKLRGLSRAGLAAPAPVRFVAADLAADREWPQRVGSTASSTLVVLEGLLMYLDRGEVEALLVERLPALGDGPLRVVFSYMVDWPQGRGGFRPSSRLVDAWLAMQREPFRWLHAADAIPTWVDGLGYATVAHACPPFDAAAALDGSTVVPGRAGVLRGENLVEALRRRP